MRCWSNKIVVRYASFCIESCGRVWIAVGTNARLDAIWKFHLGDILNIALSELPKSCTSFRKASRKLGGAVAVKAKTKAKKDLIDSAGDVVKAAILYCRQAPLFKAGLREVEINASRTMWFQDNRPTLSAVTPALLNCLDNAG